MPDHEPIGSPATKLVVIRGNSGSGKSSIAKALRLRCGRGCALVDQDYLRRIVLRELDKPGGIAPALIAQTVRFALDHGLHVVLEGILVTAHYAEMIKRLLASHCGESYVFYLDVSLEETLRRHTLRPQSAEFTADDMRNWYLPADHLGVAGEHVIHESSTFEQAEEFIAGTAGFPPAEVSVQDHVSVSDLG